MKISRKISITIIISISVAIFVNLQGILNSLFSLNLETGELNPILGSLLFLILLFIHIYNYLNHNNITKINSVTILALISTVFLIIFGLQFSGTTKLLRDILYLWMIVLIYLNLKYYNNAKIINDKYFIKYLFLFHAILFPLIGLIFVGIDFDGRYAGFVMSKPNFANSMLLVSIMYCSLNTNIVWKFINIAISAFWITLSGTRTPLIMLLILLMYTILQDYDRNKTKSYKMISYIVMFMIVCIGLYAMHWESIAYNSDMRVLNFQDDGGSIHSRIVWYSVLVNQLFTDNIWGGYGAGASEYYLGLLPHFDILRFWFDYSIIYVLLFVVIIFMINRIKRDRNISIAILVMNKLFIFSIVILLSLHNSFQSYYMILLLTLTLFYSGYNFGMKYRVANYAK